MQERLVQILEAIAGTGGPVSISELIRITDLPRATLYRNIASLEAVGFVETADGGNRYTLGMRFVKIALTGKDDSHVINSVSAILRKIVREIGETAFLARYRGGRVDIIHNEVPSDPAISYVYPGTGARPAHACSSAKAIAAFITPELRDDLIEAHPIRYNAYTIVDPDQVKRELIHVQRNGYAICDGEIDEGVTSIAVPIIIDRLGSVFSLGVVGPSNRIRQLIQNRIVPILAPEAVRAAAAITHCSVIDAESTNASSLASARQASARENAANHG